MLILEWNAKKNIKLFRIGSDFAPHATNPEFIPRAKHEDFRAMAYPLTQFSHQLRKIGAYARKNGIRLTFHPDPFIVLGTTDPGVLIRSIRELYFHTRVLDVMGTDLNSVIVLHGGGTYGNKASAMRRWVKNFDKLPVAIKRRIVIENDEYSFNTSDMLHLSKSVKPYTLTQSKGAKQKWRQDPTYHIPVVFDIFHYECYDRVLQKRWRQQDEGERYFHPDQLSEQLPMEQLLPLVDRSWGSRIMKMHISSQKRGGQLGAHADYVTSIPQYILDRYGGPRTRTDLMVEAKAKEKAVARLHKKYPKRTDA